MGDSGSSGLMRLQSSYKLGLQSSENLPGIGGSTPKIDPVNLASQR